MNTPVRFGTAVWLLASASLIIGCAASQTRVETSGFGGRAGEDTGLATRALMALQANDVPTAIGLAERAVEKTPDDAGYRGLLGNAYFAGGRFASAEAAYKDSLAIYSSQPQVILKLALVEIAQGKNQQALAFLEAGRDQLDASDYGLALALAGQPRNAVHVLDAAAHDPAADSRVRQNLALAYALAGDWTQARTVASQDVPANQMDARMHQWMQLASPASASDQVAALTGVKPAASDPGEPVRLALIPPEVRTAAATPVTAPAPKRTTRKAAKPAARVVAAAPVTPKPVQTVAAPKPIVAPPVQKPVQTAAVAPPPFVAPPVAVARPVAFAPPPPPAPAPVVPAAAPAPASILQAAAATVAQIPAEFAALTHKFTAPAHKAAPAHRVAAPGFKAPVRSASVVHRGTSGAVMQLGSYRSPEYVMAAWTVLTHRYPALREYLPMRARFDSPNGTYWRLSVQGFASQREAIARCQLLKSHGGNCFVRNFAGDAPVQIASAK
jgi:D-alanyl-D-alanine carboxypeptidase